MKNKIKAICLSKTNILSVSFSKADSDLEKVKSLQLKFKPYKVGPQKMANYFKKIRYLQNDIFN
jgi:hypothetical protein